HATCPSDRPNSLAQTLTECKAPRPFLRSWLRRAVLPSTARMGCSTPVAAAAVARNDSTSSQNKLERHPGAAPSARDERHPFAESRSASSARSKGTLLSKQPTWQSQLDRSHRPTPPSKR